MQITNQANNTLFFQAEELHWNILLGKKILSKYKDVIGILIGWLESEQIEDPINIRKCH